MANKTERKQRLLERKATLQRQLNQLVAQERREERRAHTKRLIEAGKLVEQAGLLDESEELVMRLLLASNKELRKDLAGQEEEDEESPKIFDEDEPVENATQEGEESTGETRSFFKKTFGG